MKLPVWKRRLFKILAWSGFATMFLAYYGLAAWFIPSRQYSNFAFWPALAGCFLIYCSYYWATSHPSIRRKASRSVARPEVVYGPVGRFLTGIVLAAHGYPAVHYGAPAVLSYFVGQPAKAVVTVESDWRSIGSSDDGCLAYGLKVYSQDLGQWQICVFSKILHKTQPGTKVELNGTQSALGFRYDSNKTVVLGEAKAEN